MSKEVLLSPVKRIENNIKNTFRKSPETRTGLIYRDETLHTIADALAHALTKEIRVHGVEHLHQVRSLVAAEKRVVFASRHEAHLDAVALDQSLEQEGFSDLSDIVFNMYGIRLEKGIMSSWMSDSQSRIRIWPPFDKPRSDEEKRVKESLDQTSLSAAKEALDMGLIINIFPEGTRAGSTREMMEPISAVVGFFDAIEADYIVPVAIDGTQNILPRGKWPRRSSYDVTYCEPIDYKMLKQHHADKKYKPFRQAVMYDIMNPIAEVLPPERRGYFAK